MKIAVFGGAFDPPHLGHLQVARTILEHSYADEVWFLPVKDHPFEKKMSSDADRAAMVRLMLEPGMRLELLELSSHEKNYTLVSLRLLQKQYPEHTFLFIVGSDNISEFHRWYHYDELIQEFQVWVYPRAGSSMEGLLPGMHILDHAEPVQVSSTEIRERCKQGASIAGLVSDSVAEYIDKRGLYTQKK